MITRYDRLCLQAYLEHCNPNMEHCKDCKRYSPVFIIQRPAHGEEFAQATFDTQNYNPITFEKLEGANHG